MQLLTKSGHKIYPQNCFSEYDKTDVKDYKGYQYTLTYSCLYVYEDMELVFSREIWHDTPESRENWAKYFIQELINKKINSPINQFKPCN